LSNKSKIEIIQPPEQLMSGFLDFANEVYQKSLDRGAKFTEEEITAVFNDSFSGKVRTMFFLWIGDINKIIDAINIILSDLQKLRNDKSSLDGNPVVRSEFLLQAFFGEFFRIKEISKIFIKFLTQIDLLNNKNKEEFVGVYYTAFDWAYELRNKIIHQGATIRDSDFNIDISFIENLSKDERDKFISLIQNSNTREDTVEIQCAIYMELISEIMDKYIEFQTLFNSLLADLIISYEKMVIKITVTKNDE
jgi:hypothetical protein